MANLIPPPVLPVENFSLRFAASSQRIRSRFTGRERAYRTGNGRWVGTVSWSPAVDRSFRGRVIDKQWQNSRLLLRFHELLSGRENQVDIVLPGGYQSDQLPDGARATLSALSKTGGLLRARITLASSQGATLEIGNYLNLGTRLYQISQATPPNYSLVPQSPPVPISGPTPELTVHNVFVRAQLAGDVRLAVADIERGITYDFMEV